MISAEKIRELSEKLMHSRMRLLCDHGFYGLLLMHMIFTLDKELDTAATDGERIFWGVEFLESLYDDEVDFVLMHEILHIILLHILRGTDMDQNISNIACDIVVNSIILEEYGLAKAPKFKNLGEPIHLAPDGKEGRLYTMEQVYDMLLKNTKKAGAKGSNASIDAQAGGNGSWNGSENDSGNGSEKHSAIGKRKGSGTGGENDSGDGGEQGSGIGKRNGSEVSRGKGSKVEAGIGLIDCHDKWKELGKGEHKDNTCDTWQARALNAALTMEIRDSQKDCGSMGLMASRVLAKLRKSKLNWREILNSFVQEDICDYSFMPPDKRFDECDFYLPDFNEKENSIKNIWFVVDTSGSISDSDLAAAYSEILSAIEQFNGRLEGAISFFDAQITDPIPFCSVEELLSIKPLGGGGTSFEIIFNYLIKRTNDEQPSSIVIITDGYAKYPSENPLPHIPVFWLLTTSSSQDTPPKPPWGKTATIELNKN